MHTRILPRLRDWLILGALFAGTLAFSGMQFSDPPPIKKADRLDPASSVKVVKTIPVKLD